MTLPSSLPSPAPTGTSAARNARPAVAQRRVIDVPTRMFHWLFALSFAGAYLTADSERLRHLHITLGYAMAGLLVFRVLFGLFGPRQAALGVLWRKLSAAPAWLKALWAARALRDVPWRQGQNLLMPLAIVSMLALALPLVLSGYAVTDAPSDWLGLQSWSDAHDLLGEGMAAAAVGHLALILVLSLLRRKNQATPMLLGCVEGPGPHLVAHNRGALAVLLLSAFLAYGAWEWGRSPEGLFPIPRILPAEPTEAVASAEARLTSVSPSQAGPSVLLKP